MNTVSRLHTTRMIAKCDERLSMHGNAPSNVVHQRFSTPIGVESATISHDTDRQVSTNERDDDHRRRVDDWRRAGRPHLGGTAPQYGISVRGDALRVSLLRDGTDLDAVWQLFQDALAIWNTERSGITDLLTFRTTLHAEAVPQNFSVGRCS
jgi:hypothetical protein